MIAEQQVIDIAKESGALKRNTELCFEDDELLRFARILYKKALLDAANRLEENEYVNPSYALRAMAATHNA